MNSAILESNSFISLISTIDENRLTISRFQKRLVSVESIMILLLSTVLIVYKYNQTL